MGVAPQADVILGYIHGPRRALPKEAGAEVEVVVRPLVFEHKQARPA